MKWLEKIRIANRAEKTANNILVGTCLKCGTPHCVLSPRRICYRCIVITLKDFAQYPDDVPRPILFLRPFHLPEYSSNPDEAHIPPSIHSSRVSNWASNWVSNPGRNDRRVTESNYLIKWQRIWSDVTNLEDNLVAAIDSLNMGPVITIGRSGEKLPRKHSATRLFFKNEVWQEKVRELMLLSQLVVIEAAYSTGLEWEMVTALKQLRPEQIIFSFVSWHLYSQDWRERQWEILAMTLTRIAGVQIPSQGKNNYLMYFEKDWTPRLVSDYTAPPLLNELHRKLRYLELWRRIKLALLILLALVPILYPLIILLIS
jgi:hypothetical protein